MASLNPKDPKHIKRRRPWLRFVVIALVSLLVVILVVFGALFYPGSEVHSDHVHSPLETNILAISHDELITLIISLVVVIMVAVNLKLLRRLPYFYLLLCSFMLVVVSATFTIVETVVFEQVLNYLEHLSFMAASILLALWCWRVFGSKKHEGS